MKDWRRVAHDARRRRVRKRVRGSDGRPRLCVYRSQRHTYAQVISDATGRTLVAVSTLSRELRETLPRKATKDAARQVGLTIARQCLERGISRVIFDRNGFLFHGRIKALADGAREGGLQV